LVRVKWMEWPTASVDRIWLGSCLCYEEGFEGFEAGDGDSIAASDDSLLDESEEEDSDVDYEND